MRRLGSPVRAPPPRYCFTSFSGRLGLVGRPPNRTVSVFTPLWRSRLKSRFWNHQPLFAGTDSTNADNGVTGPALEAHGERSIFSTPATRRAAAQAGPISLIGTSFFFLEPGDRAEPQSCWCFSIYGPIIVSAAEVEKKMRPEGAAKSRGHPEG